MTSGYIKSDERIKSDIILIDKRIAMLNEEIVNKIRDDAGFDSSYSYSLFRPKPDLAMLLFKQLRKSPSEYTINLLTLKPTINSKVKNDLSKEIVNYFN